jgi:hypothetical protein
MCFKWALRRGLYMLCFLSQMVPASGLSTRAPHSEVITVPYEDISTRVQIIGKLRCPLMEVVTVCGRWSVDNWPNPKETVFVVTHVNGKVLNPPAEFLKVDPVEKADADLDRRVTKEEWELRGVETGGFVGFSPEVRKKLGLQESHGGRPLGMGGKAVDCPPNPTGFVTRFCYASARRIHEPLGKEKKVKRRATPSPRHQEQPGRQHAQRKGSQNEQEPFDD